MDWSNYSDTLREASKAARESNDCTVMAWSNCFDAPYLHAHTWLSRYGRLPRRGMSKTELIVALDSCKKSKVRKGPYSRDNRISLSRFCKKHNTGRYYVLVRGHALCVKDGVVYDWYHGPRRQVTFAARVYLEGEL